MNFKDISKKIKFNFKCDYELLICSRMTFFSKISYLIKRYCGIILDKRSISFMGTDFFYDTKFGGAILEGYPKEIETIDKLINFSEIKNILDIGANIGQFAFITKKFFPQADVFSFEPNKSIFPILKRNSDSFENWNPHNYGIAEKNGTREFFYSEEASTEGSFFEENLYQSYLRKGNKHIKVDVINLNSSNLKKLKLPKYFNLVKIDVEGAEIEVLKSLKNISFDYLWIEVSIKREKGASVEDIKKIIKQDFKKDCELIYLEPVDKNTVSANTLFRIK